MKEQIKQRIAQLNKGTIPEGYKRTEFGVFPHDWATDKTLADIGQFGKGKGLPGDKMTTKGIPCVGYGDIYMKYNHFYFEEAENFVDEETAKESQPIDKGTLLFTGTGETAEEIGKCICYFGDQTIYAGGDIITFIPRNVNPLFLTYQQYQDFSLRKKASYGQGHSVVHIQKGSLEKLNVAYPPSADEQAAIVRILVCCDERVKLQEQYLYQLNKRHKWYLQKYLKGSSLRYVKLGDICEIRKGDQLNNSELNQSGQFPMMNGGITESGFTDSYNRSENTITISEGGNSCGFVNFIKQRFWCGGHCYTLHNIQIDQDALFYILKANETSIMQLRCGSGLPNIQKSSLESFRIGIISDTKYLDKLTRVLKDSDQKILLNEKLLLTMKAQRKALHQYLLNGLVRVNL